MTTEWPSSMVIKSREWKIVYANKDHPELREGPGPDDWLLGVCNEHTRTIHICTDQSRESMRDTLVHELMHAAYCTAPGLDHECEESEENVILFSTEAFFEIVCNSAYPWWLPSQ